jgi:putative glycosyltransferase (TIGR04372 family)
MDHAILRFRGNRVLLANVHHSAEGRGIGYGQMLIRMRRALLLARMMGMAVYLPPSGRPINGAVLELESPDVEIIRARSWTARVLRARWALGAPFRFGRPGLWAASVVARFATGSVYRHIKQSRLLPSRFRKYLLGRQALYARLKAVNAEYAAHCERNWQALYRSHVLEPLRAAEEGGDAPPTLRLRLPAEQAARLARAAAALGVSSNTPIVTVHVRETGFRQASQLRQREWDVIRNARIETFELAFEALVERGYTVVRLGDPTMTPVAVRGVIDLATAPERDPWLDIWFTARSRFLVGCDSGPSWLAVMLDIPVLTVNAVHFRDMARDTDRMICKLARDRRTGQLLTIEEMLTGDFLKAGFKSGDYECVDNSPKDIRRAVLDMIDVVEGREERLSWGQKRFNARLRRIDRFREGGASALEGVAVTAGLKGTISRRFARQYFSRQDPGAATASSTPRQSRDT